MNEKWRQVNQNRVLDNRFESGGIWCICIGIVINEYHAYCELEKIVEGKAEDSNLGQ